MKKELMQRIFLIEWEMFKNVQNFGGTAQCQQNKKTFLIMRMSQMAAWTEAMLSSYLKDLEMATKEGRNLMTEKYARMMEYTFPKDYKELAHRLPEVSSESRLLVDKITTLMLAWAMQMKLKYPNVIGAGRPIYSLEDTSQDTSIETYCRGELLTYGTMTLSICWEHYSKCLLEEINCYELVLDNMVKLYGYKSIEDANCKKAYRHVL